MNTNKVVWKKKVPFKVKNIKIIVASHKKYQMPEDDVYLPLHVGCEGKENIGYQGDNTGDNISTKNPNFCELTGLYWAWKNLDADYIGLVQYRRHFSVKKFIPRKENKKFKTVLSKEEIEKRLKNYDIILPKKRNYFIEKVYSHYEHTMHIEPLIEAGKIIQEKYPRYYPEFQNLKKTTKLHAFNMFIMKKEYLDKYCEWLFDILFELEKRIDVSKYNTFHARFFGRVSERMLDIWIRTNDLKYDEIKVINTQNINWFNKIKSFLISKFMNKKYEKSF